MPVVDTPVHEKVREKEGAKYGCWNKPRPKGGDEVRSIYAMPRSWPYVFSEECRYDMSLTDSKCEGCKWRGSGEAYDAMVRSNGK
jgi:hypothetical protein